MSLSQRRKGRTGQCGAAHLLRARDWIVDEISCGIMREDIVGTDTDGNKYSIEIKNCAGILPAHKRQAMEQAKRRGLNWMLMNKISGTSAWLVQRKGAAPVVWHMKGEMSE